MLTAKQFGDLIAEYAGGKPMTRSAVLNYLHKGRVAWTRSELGWFQIEEEEAMRFIKDDYLQGGQIRNRGKRRKSDEQ